MRLRFAWLLMVVTLAVAAGGCTGGAKAPSDDTGASVVETSEIPGESSVANEGDLEYVRGLGASQQGKTLYAIVVASEATKAAAEADALAALSSMGDVQAYFVVEPASHLAGLPTGQYHVCELHRDKPGQDVIDFIDRGPSPAKVYKVTVKCTDPIPVFEDQEGQ